VTWLENSTYVKKFSNFFCEAVFCSAIYI